MYLDEMRDELEEVYDRKFSLPTISRRLKEAKWSKVEAVKAAKQRNIVLRDNHQYQMREFSRSQLVYVDESAANEKVGDRKRIWSYRESRTTPAAAAGPSSAADAESSEPKPFNKGEKFSILPAFTIDGE